MAINKSPHHTSENYERLLSIIRPMQTLDEFIAAFPECDAPVRRIRYDCAHRMRILEDMQDIPRDTVDGILAHVCGVCGSIMLEKVEFRLLAPGLCFSCADEWDGICRPGKAWNGLTVRGQDAGLGIIYRDFRIPGIGEMSQYERKKRLRASE